MSPATEAEPHTLWQATLGDPWTVLGSEMRWGHRRKQARLVPSRATYWQ